MGMIIDNLFPGIKNMNTGRAGAPKGIAAADEGEQDGRQASAAGEGDTATISKAGSKAAMLLAKIPSMTAVKTLSPDQRTEFDGQVNSTINEWAQGNRTDKIDYFNAWLELNPDADAETILKAMEAIDKGYTLPENTLVPDLPRMP